MSDHQRPAAGSRITSLGGIKPTRLPSSAVPEISLKEAEKRLGIAQNWHENAHSDTQNDQQAGVQDVQQGSHTESITASNTASLPASLLNKKKRNVTVSRTFRLPLELANELEEIATLHDIPMVSILAEALEIHLARFPKQKT